MAKFSTPGVYTTEIDNTIRNNSDFGVGVGAIVMKSNKGPVNQRVLVTSYDEFKSYYGAPESETDYGHFAAKNFLDNSRQLLVVRATMGDEGYAQVQYPYSDTVVDSQYDTAKNLRAFGYVDNEKGNNIKIVAPIIDEDGAKIYTAMTKAGWEKVEGKNNTPEGDKVEGAFVMKKSAYRGFVYDDILSYGDENTQSSAIIYSATVKNNTDVFDTKQIGLKVAFGSEVNNETNYLVFPFKFSKLEPDENDAEFDYYNKELIIDPKEIKFVKADSTKDETEDYFLFTLPASKSWTGKSVSGKFKLKANSDAEKYLKIAIKVANGQTTPSAGEENDYQDAAKAEYINTKTESGTTTYESILLPISKVFESEIIDSLTGTFTVEYIRTINVIDWDENASKEITVLTPCPSKSSGTFSSKVFSTDTQHQIAGIEFIEYGMNNYNQVLICVSDKDEGNDPDNAIIDFPELLESNPQKAKEIASNYAIDALDVNSTEWCYLKYRDAYTDEDVELIVRSNEKIRPKEYAKNNTANTKDGNAPVMHKDLFVAYKENLAKDLTFTAVYTHEDVKEIIVPWSYSTDEETGVSKLNALPSSEVLSATNEKYRDGYQPTIESDDEPGNGDIESYNSNKDNQLIIAAMSPGEWGNNIGVSIITPEASEYEAFDHQNAFNWKYRYDDEDVVDDDFLVNGWKSNPKNLTWKKVYRVNVYVKDKTKTAAGAWGFGLDSLLKDPIEFFYVSNDPTAKDAEGNSLYAPDVINGHSEYIYVSRNSVNAAKSSKGYELPFMTYGIYQLTGGINSTKNKIAEKTCALNLFSDRKKADFDIIFNVEAIDTFNGRERFGAHQRRIAEIAANRKQDIAVIQVSSKESKTIKRMLSEGANFKFNNGSYISCYAGYDKYYDADISSNVYLPKSVGAACAMAYCDNYAYPWLAPAGVNRGQISFSTKQLVRLTEDEIGQLYTKHINTSTNNGTYGEYLLGQKTALKKDSLLNRINVRRCLNYIEKRLETLLLPFLFEQNIQDTRSAMKEVVNTFLTTVQTRGGLEGFRCKVEKDKDDPNTVNVYLGVVPASAIEFINVVVEINRTLGTISFSDEE